MASQTLFLTDDLSFTNVHVFYLMCITDKEKTAFVSSVPVIQSHCTQQNDKKSITFCSFVLNIWLAQETTHLNAAEPINVLYIVNKCTYWLILILFYKLYPFMGNLEMGPNQ